MSGLNHVKLGSTLSNICNTTQLDDASKCHYAFRYFWGEPCLGTTFFSLSTYRYEKLKIIMLMRYIINRIINCALVFSTPNNASS